MGRARRLTLLLLYLLVMCQVSKGQYQYASVKQDTYLLSFDGERCVKLFKGEWVRTDSLCSVVYLGNVTYKINSQLNPYEKNYVSYNDNFSGNFGWLTERAELRIRMRAKADTIYLFVPERKRDATSRYFKLINQTTNECIGMYESGREIKITPTHYTSHFMNANTLLRISPEGHFPTVVRIGTINTQWKSCAERIDTITPLDTMGLSKVAEAQDSEEDDVGNDEIKMSKRTWYAIVIFFVIFVCLTISCIYIIIFKPDWLILVFPISAVERSVENKRSRIPINATQLLKLQTEKNNTNMDERKYKMQIDDWEVRYGIAIKRVDELTTKIGHLHIENKTLNEALERERKEIARLDAVSSNLRTELNVISEKSRNFNGDLLELLKNHSLINDKNKFIL